MYYITVLLSFLAPTNKLVDGGRRLNRDPPEATMERSLILEPQLGLKFVFSCIMCIRRARLVAKLLRNDYKNSNVFLAL